MEASPNIVQPVADEIMNQLSHGITEIALIRDHIKNFALPLLYLSLQVCKVGHRGQGGIGPTFSLLPPPPKFSGFTCIKYFLHSFCSTKHFPAPPLSLPFSVYSIIMDQASGAGATLELGEGQLQTTKHEVHTTPSLLVCRWS